MEHRTQKIAREFLIRFEKENLPIEEAFITIGFMVHQIGIGTNISPQGALKSLQLAMAKIGEQAKKRDHQDKIWTPQ